MRKRTKARAKSKASSRLSPVKKKRVLPKKLAPKKRASKKLAPKKRASKKLAPKKLAPKKRVPKAKPRKGSKAYAAWLKRSRAAKRGWETRLLSSKLAEARREIALLKSKAQRDLALLKSKAQRDLALLKSKAKIESRRESRKRSRLKSRTTYLETRLVKAERDAAPTWRTEDGKIALNPSRLRKWRIESRQEVYDRLAGAWQSAHFDEEAMSVARDYQVPLREVYSFFYSP